jgi:two-component system OmpR family response regulator
MREHAAEAIPRSSRRLAAVWLSFSRSALPVQPFRRSALPAAERWSRIASTMEDASGSIRILLVEDDPETRRLVSAALREAGYSPTAVATGADAYREILAGSFRAIVLDVRLPDADGISLCRQWRGAGIDTPILILTAKTDVGSRIDGLNSGADDYLGKPFALAELRARLNAILRRRSDRRGSAPLRMGEVTVDFGRRRVTRSKREILLTRREFELLERLVQAGGNVVSRHDLMTDVWGDATSETEASLEVIVGRLRRKLTGPGDPPLIRTLRGVGYALESNA